MSLTATFYNLNKRKNSTKQPTGTGTQFSINLKSGTSFISPTFLLEISGTPNYNYCQFEGRFYFVTDIISVRNDLWEISCEIDALATYKNDILSSTQFVAYSSVSGGTWLADTRIPLLNNATVQKNSSTMNFLFTAGGFYVLSAVGQDGCHTYCLDLYDLQALINDLSTWRDDLKNWVLDQLPFTSPTTEVQASQNLYTVLAKSGVLGNAYLDAPNCIRSCIWVPFFASFFTGNSRHIYLGQYDTGITAFLCNTSPASNSLSINIPWQHSDWRRATCESVYLYLPLVGLINIPTNEIINETALTIEWSCTATDGAICYCVKAGNQIIGSYGASCSVNYPIGISQQASAGEIINATLAGTEKMLSNAINSSISPISMAGSLAGAVFQGAKSGYDVQNIKFSSHNTCIGGIGGGAGVGLDLDATCFTVSHDTIIAPSAMQATMGVPTQKPILLSTASGYCQCVNAHVETTATSVELDLIDNYINNGFYIE